MKKRRCAIGLALTIILNLSVSVLLPGKMSKAMAIGSVADDVEPYIYSSIHKRNIPVRDVRDEALQISKSIPHKPEEDRSSRFNSKVRDKQEDGEHGGIKGKSPDPNQ